MLRTFALATSLFLGSALHADDGGIPNIPCDRADFNGDGKVDGADLGFFLFFWGTSNQRFDLNNDGIVDGGDLGLFLLAWYYCENP